MPTSVAEELGEPDVARLFHREMVHLYQRAKDEAGYVATYFIQMVADRGGLETARHLLQAHQTSEGFTALWERQRLDLSVEALVLREPFPSLFTGDELQTARARLEAYGYSE